MRLDQAYGSYRRELLMQIENYSAEPLETWVMQTSLILGYRRADADSFELLQAHENLRLDPRTIENDATRFWLAVYFRVATCSTSHDLARIFNVPQFMIHAALVHRALPMTFLFFTPPEFIQMLDYAGLELNESEEFNMFFDNQ